MDWTEIKLSIDANELERAAAICNMAVPYGIYIEDYRTLEEEAREIAHIDLIDEALLQKDRSIGIIHLYISPEENPAEPLAFLKERFDSEQIAYQVELAGVKEEDWATAWKKYYKPTRIGEKLVIVPSWESFAPQRNDVVLTLDPGMAFGTGTHETTRLCLEAAQTYITPGCSCLDVGCGSGILSIGAKLLGAQSALGVDIDALAVKTAQENATLNGVADHCRFLQGNLTDRVEGTFDIVFANIVADVILLLLCDLHRFLKPGGVLITSGIIEPRANEVLNALNANGYRVLKRAEDKGWCCITATR